MVNTHCAACDWVKCSKENFQFILQDTKVIPVFSQVIITQWHLKYSMTFTGNSCSPPYSVYLTCFALSESVSLWCKTGELFKHFDLWSLLAWRGWCTGVTKTTVHIKVILLGYRNMIYAAFIPWGRSMLIANHYMNSYLLQPPVIKYRTLYRMTPKLIPH